MDKFLVLLAEMLEVEIVEINTCNGILADIIEWDSIARLGFIAMADTEYGKRVKLDDVKAAKTVTELFQMVV